MNGIVYKLLLSHGGQTDVGNREVKHENKAVHVCGKMLMNSQKLNGPNSYVIDKFTKLGEIRSSWSRNEYCLNTHLPSRYSYLVIIGTKSHEQLTKSKIISNWSWFKHCSESPV